MQTYYAVNGEEMDSNVSGNQFLAKITLGLWDKAGIPKPLSEDDARLVARILRNYASLQRATRQTSNFVFWQEFGFGQDDYDTIAWVERTAMFFERSGGLLDEAEGLRKSEKDDK